MSNPQTATQVTIKPVQAASWATASFVEHGIVVLRPEFPGDSFQNPSASNPAPIYALQLQEARNLVAALQSQIDRLDPVKPAQ